MSWPDRAKLARELARICRQATSPVRAIWQRHASARYYDAVLARRIHRSPGDLPWSDRMAVCLIFPSDGLCDSHIDALRIIRRHGFAPLVVSNRPLSAPDRDRLRPLAAGILERPNVGYDFGGYRDGVLDLAPRLSQSSRLLLTNDSVWWLESGQPDSLVPNSLAPDPFGPDPFGPHSGQRGAVARDWLDDAARRTEDFVGYTTHFGVNWRHLDDLDDFEWRHDPDRRGFHYGSFALLCGTSLIRAAVFQDFWRRLALTDTKRDVVARGEMGLTRMVLDANVSHAATVDGHRLDHELRDLSDDRIAWAAELLILLDDRRWSEDYAAALSATDDPAVMRRLILGAVARQGLGYALPHLLLAQGRLRFIKKAPLSSQPSGIVRTLHLGWMLDGPQAGMIRREMRGRVERWLHRCTDPDARSVVAEALDRAAGGRPPLHAGSRVLRRHASAALVERRAWPP